MDFADDISCEVIGVFDLLDSVQPRSSWGASLASQPRLYRLADEESWRAEQLRLAEVEAWWDDERAQRVTAAFEQLPTIDRPLLTLESEGVLDEVALFELKRFFYWGLIVIRAASGGIGGVEPAWESSLAELMAIIHPERQPSPRFILAAQLDDRLAEARQLVKKARRAERSVRAAFEAELVTELGGKFDVGGRFVATRGSEPLVDSRLRPLGGGKYEVVDPRIDELAGAVAAANDSCWDIEVEVRQRLSTRLRAEIDLLTRVRDALGRLDVRCALVELRRSWGGCWPRWGTTTIVEGGRHPRLLNVLDIDEVQPISVTLDDRPVIVTGPNMGGKSLLLELVGLCQWCAQHGFPIPADVFEFTPIEGIVYVGSEEQAARSGLSSFGREVRRVVEQGGQSPPLLWLLDEFGRGTHPDEGATIARDFILSRARAGDRVVAATHFPSLAGLEEAAHFRIAGISHPEALRVLEDNPQLDDIEAALRAAMDYRPIVRNADDRAVPRDARLVASVLGLELGGDD